jgi:hypothetical protein
MLGKCFATEPYSPPQLDFSRVSVEWRGSIPSKILSQTEEQGSLESGLSTKIEVSPPVWMEPPLPVIQSSLLYTAFKWVSQCQSHNDVLSMEPWISVRVDKWKWVLSTVGRTQVTTAFLCLPEMEEETQCSLRKIKTMSDLVVTLSFLIQKDQYIKKCFDLL